MPAAAEIFGVASVKGRVSRSCSRIAVTPLSSRSGLSTADGPRANNLIARSRASAWPKMVPRNIQKNGGAGGKIEQNTRHYVL